MKLRIAENFRAVFYAPFYAIRALGLAEREGLQIEWLPSDTPGGALEQVKRGNRRPRGRADARAQGSRLVGQRQAGVLRRGGVPRSVLPHRPRQGAALRAQ